MFPDREKKMELTGHFTPADIDCPFLRSVYLSSKNLMTTVV